MTVDEKDLLIGCFEGDQLAQAEFVTRFSNLIYNTVVNTLKVKGARWRSQDAEDLHQEVFIRLLDNSCRRLRQFQGKNGCSLRSWVRMIAVRTVIDHLRSRKDALAASVSDPSELLDQLQADLPDALTSLESCQQQQKIQRGLQSLRPRDRLFIKLHFFQELPLEEVATILGITPNNAYSLKHRALSRLRDAVQGSGRRTDGDKDG